MTALSLPLVSIESNQLIHSHHWQEWEASQVHPALIAASLESLSGDAAIQTVCYAAFDQLGAHSRFYMTSEQQALLSYYQHLTPGGWWVSGLDPLSNWQRMIWGQFKPDCPRPDPKRPGRFIKYETPPKTPTRALFLPVPLILSARYLSNHLEQVGVAAQHNWLRRLRQQIQQKLDCSDVWVQQLLQVCQQHSTVAALHLLQTAWADSHQLDFGSLLDDGFWNWVQQFGLPICITEGAKKAGCLISQGIAAIALPGVNSGYRSKDRLGNPIQPYLIPEITLLAVPGRRVVLAFDQDEMLTTRRRVCVALNRFGMLLQQHQMQVAIAQWQPQQGKGVDDLIASQGVAVWKEVYTNALSFDQWQILMRLEQKLTYRPNLTVCTADLSQLRQTFPESGLIAVASAKGTGKTKLVSKLIQQSSRVLGAVHRVALARNLCERLQLDYRGDLDKVKGQFFSGSGYTLRVGFCVDAMLAIQPAHFTGCDLIIDEVVQVLRHMISSTTCAQDGKRPALLARFRELIQAARRVIVADADLDNASIRYLQTLRGDSSLFLIQNNYQPNGYPVRFFDTPDRGGITQELLQAVTQLQQGQVIYVATDNRRESKALRLLIEQQRPDLRILVINSQTSGGERETEFMQRPDAVLEGDQYDVIIASPSVATGVSIEVQGVIAKVFGIFTGVSSTDADMAQALGRVREPVERIVWCAKRGSNFCRASRSGHPLELKRHLYEKTALSVRLIRAGLREDVAGEINAYDWQSDPHLHLYAQFGSQQNLAMQTLRTSLLVRLRSEGNRVKIETTADLTLRQRAAEASRVVRLQEAEQIVASKILSNAEVKELENMQEQNQPLSQEQQTAIARYYLCDFYCLTPESLNLETVLRDREGRSRTELLSLEAQQVPFIDSRDVQSIERQARWQKGFTPWDFTHVELRRRMRQKLKLEDFLDKHKEWTAVDLKPYADYARSVAAEIKAVLNFTIPSGTKTNGQPKMSDVQIVHQLLSQLGVKVTFRWSRSVPGQEGKKLRVYRLDEAEWHRAEAILQARANRRMALSQSVVPQSGSPQILNQYSFGMGDPESSCEQVYPQHSVNAETDQELCSLDFDSEQGNA